MPAGRCRCTACRSPSRTTSTSPGSPTTAACPATPTRPRPDAGSVAPAARRRRDRRRQDQPRPVRHRPQRHPLPVRRSRERVRRRPDLRRVELRLGGRRRLRGRRLRPGHRHRRLRPGAGRAERDRRAQADPRAASAPRRASRPAARWTASACSPATSPTPPPCSRCCAGPDAGDPWSRPHAGPVDVPAAGLRLGCPGRRPRLRRRHRHGRRVRRRRRTGALPGVATGTSTSRRCSRPATCSTAARGSPSGSPTSRRSSPTHPDGAAGHPRGPRPRPRLHRRRRLPRPAPPAGAAGRERPAVARHDVLVLPTVPTTFTRAEIAEEPMARNLVLGRYTQFANLLDLAAVAVPNGFTADGRPVGVTLLGPAFSEARLLAAATEVHHLPRRPHDCHSAPTRTRARIGPVDANPYAWPYDGTVDPRSRAGLHRLADRLLRPGRLRRHDGLRPRPHPGRAARRRGGARPRALDRHAGDPHPRGPPPRPVRLPAEQAVAVGAHRRRDRRGGPVRADPGARASRAGRSCPRSPRSTAR